MEEKQQNNKELKKLDKKVYLIGAIAVLVVLVMVIGGMAMAKNEPKIATVKINTPHIDLLIPEKVAEYITNDVSTYGNVYTCAFYLNHGDIEVPLWRLDFGDANAGDWVGMLKTDSGDIPVVMTGFLVGDEQLVAMGEEGSQLYGECMQGYSTMLDGIMSDPRFTAERPLAVGEDTIVQLTYWKVTLPDTMHVSESNADGNYEALFSGQVKGEMIPLYRVCIGEKQARSPLGYYKVDGVKMPVSVESFDLGEQETWSEDDYAAAYKMMDTINPVIETIMKSKQFTTDAE